MDRKLQSTIMLLVLLVIVIAAGGIYTYLIQKGEIEDKEKKLEEINVNAYDTNDLLDELLTLQKRAAELDSILSLRKYNIPVDLKQSSFFNFVNKVSFNFSSRSFVNIEYIEVEIQENFSYYVYQLNGTAYFSDIYKLIYAIEESKELKKVLKANMTNFVEVDEEGYPHYMVTFNMDVAVYFSDNDRFAASNMKENRLTANPIYDIFYPLIRNEIPPNEDNLLDVQNAQLLALIPEGAFLSDAKGNTYLLWEGDKVYLGYLTEIDYENNRVMFVLNKGGIIDKVAIELE